MTLTQAELRLPESDRQPGEAPSERAEKTAVVPIFRRNERAKRYRLFVDRTGQPRVTIPKRGNRTEAEKFVAAHRDWLDRQIDKYRLKKAESVWRLGTEILFRGHLTRLEVAPGDRAKSVRLGTELVPVGFEIGGETDFRNALEKHLHRLAARELPLRVRELATQHGSPVQRISVRNQRSRWGSCSHRGQISLNWRLVQVPPEVCDYIILHELMHLREMNHSRRFWKHVVEVCPDYRQCEAWLRRHSALLR